jgi:hypothetical protein
MNDISCGTPIDPVDPAQLHHDLKERQKLLLKWNDYFPLEPVKPFDVRPETF